MVSISVPWFVGKMSLLRNVGTLFVIAMMWSMPVSAQTICHQEWQVDGICPACTAFFDCAGTPFAPEVPHSIPLFGLSEKRGYCTFNDRAGQCVASSSVDGENCWQCDDHDRDHLNMDARALHFVETFFAGQHSLGSDAGPHLSDGRWIYVYRHRDDAMWTRRYDREDRTHPACDALYARYREQDNFRERNGRREYLHVRHSQLNSGWHEVYAAGELRVWNGKIDAINNESGHFQPDPEAAHLALAFFVELGIPVADDVHVGDYNTHSATLTNEECAVLLKRHDGL